MKQKNQNLIQQLIGGVLVLAVIVMLGVLSVRYNVKQDWTFNKRNTISAASQKQLATMKDPIRFVAFAYPGAPERASVQFFVEQYQRFKKDVTLDFVDPSSQPQKVKEFNVSFAGEVVLEYQGRRENLRSLSEQTITGALQRLSYTGEKWIVFLEGHGERAVVDAQDQSAYTRFAQVLKDKGLNFQPLNLVKTPAIPDNTAVLVIASPKSALLEGEIKLIDAYVEKGGNLLWMADPDWTPGLKPVAERLGITWQDGYAVFPEYELLGTGHPGIFAALDYPPNPVTRGLDRVTLFPLVRSLVTQEKPDGGWSAQPLLTTSPEAWLETQPISDAGVSLDAKAGDIAGPLTIGVTLTRELPDPSVPAPSPAAEKDGEPPKPAPTRQQRVVLVGDADFISDGSLGQLGNQQLGLNIVQWLASRDSQLDIDVPKAPDTNLFLPNWAVVLIGGGFVILLPLLLIGIGVTRWVLRRRR
ncbi:MAG TPA: Gldg family protein [Vicinamibacterales bacterium]|nr:Gldg family protein [Vicinamibacterales bacterium]